MYAGMTPQGITPLEIDASQPAEMANAEHPASNYDGTRHVHREARCRRPRT
jgi:hypothetical protein